MKTGKLIITISYSNPNRKDEQSYIPVTFYKNKGTNGEKLLPEICDSTRLQQLSQMNNTYLGAIIYDIHIVMKLGYTICRNF